MSFESKYRSVLLSIAAAALTACGGIEARSAVECKVPLPVDSSAAEIERVTELVLSGKLDPCGGLSSRNSLRADALARIEDDPDVARYIFLVFRMRALRPGEGPVPSLP